MSVTDYRKKDPEFEILKENIFNESLGGCQLCRARNDLRIFFADETARKELDESKALCLCGRCFETAIALNKVLKIKADRKNKYKK